MVTHSYDSYGYYATPGTNRYSMSLYCGISVPDGYVFNRVRIRAYDGCSGSSGYVYALFYRQPWTDSGSKVFRGSVTSQDGRKVTIGSAMTDVQIDNNGYTYFVMVNAWRTSLTSLWAYQVGLSYQAAAGANDVVQEPVDCGQVEARPWGPWTDVEREACMLVL